MTARAVAAAPPEWSCARRDPLPRPLHRPVAHRADLCAIRSGPVRDRRSHAYRRSSPGPVSAHMSAMRGASQYWRLPRADRTRVLPLPSPIHWRNTALSRSVHRRTVGHCDRRSPSRCWPTGVRNDRPEPSDPRNAIYGIAQLEARDRWIRLAVGWYHPGALCPRSRKPRKRWPRTTLYLPGNRALLRRSARRRWKSVASNQIGEIEDGMIRSVRASAPIAYRRYR